MKKLFITFLLSFTIFGTYASDYIAIAKNGNVYDDSNAKYITVNQNNDDVAVIPGMVFPTSQHIPGWYKIEYSPGLHAFIPDQIAASVIKPVSSGSFDIVNQPGQKLNVENNGGNWSATFNGNTYQGQNIQDMLIFFDKNNKVAFSVVDIGNGPVAVTYDNSVTKFF